MQAKLLPKDKSQDWHFGTFALWLCPSWIDNREEFNARTWARRIEQAGLDCIYWSLKHHDGLLYFRSKRGPQFKQDFLSELLEALDTQKISIRGYYSVGIDLAMSDKHPEWNSLNADGSIKYCWGDRYIQICQNTSYQDYMLSHIDEASADA